MDVQPNSASTAVLAKENEQLFDYVKRHLSASEFQMYLVSIVGCLSSKDTFPIAFDTVAEWLGKKKSDLKRTLLEKLQNSVHYQVLSSSAHNPLGGRQSEDIWLTPRGMKSLCMRSKGRRAEEIQDYFISIEELVVQYTLDQLRREKDGLARLTSELEKHRIDVNAKLAIETHNLTCDAGNTKYFRSLEHEKEMAELKSQAEMRVLDRERELCERYGYPFAHLTVANWWNEYVTPNDNFNITINEAITHYRKTTGHELLSKNFQSELAAAGVRVTRFGRGSKIYPGFRGVRFKSLSERGALPTTGSLVISG